MTPSLVRVTISLPAPDQSLSSLNFDLGLGDFVRLSTPHTKYLKARAYSPTSAPSREGSFDITVKVYPDGVMSRAIGALKPGDTVNVLGPLPVPWLTKKRSLAHTHAGFLAMGIGITEILQLARSELCDPLIQTATLLWVVRGAEDCEWCYGELEEIAKGSGGRFQWAVHMTRDKGRPTADSLREAFKSGAEETAVLCVGTKQMMRAGYSMFAAAGFKKKLLRFGFRSPLGRRSSPMVADNKKRPINSV